ncbi:MAG: hypothetical protein LBK02_04135 [Treponema sp.]|jgi:hypothetical protein|nr:hypothetical protein [Treponema sp.]
MGKGFYFFLITLGISLAIISVIRGDPKGVAFGILFAIGAPIAILIFSLIMVNYSDKQATKLHLDTLEIENAELKRKLDKLIELGKKDEDWQVKSKDQTKNSENSNPPKKNKPRKDEDEWMHPWKY